MKFSRTDKGMGENIYPQTAGESKVLLLFENLI